MREHIQENIEHVWRSWTKGFSRYLVKALVVVVILAFIGDCAPITPMWLLPALLLLYALPAVVGSMYDVVVNRLHRQNLYNENGTLSRYNRRWVFWFGSLFVVYFVSALVYAVQAPSWDRSELALVWMTPLVYGVIFLIIQRLCRKEYSRTYYKARAIRWSIIVSALVLTAVHTIMLGQPSTDPQIDLHDIVQGRYLPFDGSPAPLLVEIDKFSTYANCLTEYGLGRLADSSYAISFVVNIVTDFSIFVGVASQFSACLLNRRELKSEFQLLPVGDDGSEEPVRKRYVAILVAIWVIFSGALWLLDQKAGEIRATSEYTAVDAWIDEMSDWAILVIEQDIDAINESIERDETSREFNDEFSQRKETLIGEQLPSVIERVNDYYDACEANIDTYAQWHDGFFGVVTRFVPMAGEGMVKDEFCKQVVDPVDAEELNNQYRSFIEGLKGLHSEYWLAEENAILAQQAPHGDADEIASSLPPELTLWADWGSEEGARVVHEVLLGENAGDGSADVRKRIHDYIESRRGEAIAFVESLPDAFGFSATLG